MVKTNKFGKILTMFLAVLMLCSMFTTTVFADVVRLTYSTESIPDAAMRAALLEASRENGAVIGAGTETTWKELKVKYKGQEYTVGEFSSDANTKVGTFVLNDDWSVLSSDTQTDVLKPLIDSLTNSKIVDKNALNQFMTDLQDQDRSVATAMVPLLFKGTRADLYQAYVIAKPFLDVLNVILGVGCVLLILLLLFSTVMDLAYIGLPMWRESTANKNGGGKTPFGVSYEAVSTVKEIESNTGGDYKNGYLLYLKHRGLTYIVLALCIVYLICGGISGIISFVLGLTSGISV